VDPTGGKKDKKGGRGGESVYDNINSVEQGKEKDTPANLHAHHVRGGKKEGKNP